MQPGISDLISALMPLIILLAIVVVFLRSYLKARRRRSDLSHLDRYRYELKKRQSRWGDWGDDEYVAYSSMRAPNVWRFDD